MRALKALLAITLLATASCGTAPAAGGNVIKVGAVFPLSGPQAPLATQEYAGVQIARDFANADGGVEGKRIDLVTKDITAASDAPARVSELQARGVQSILGAYSSTLSMPISQAAQALSLIHI